ncbi:MAG: rRNA pseudouridine synthase [Lachnospiraceae bacterium]|nr:rRNA pseudouridine synthase [Lachnospiraceae bacterium]
MRLNKYMALAGICSRRDADKLIQQGRVMVNGMIPSAGEQVGEKDTVTLDGKVIGLPEKKTVVAYYKPRGVTCTERDPYADRIVTEELDIGKRLTYAGRLDRDSEGLLIMTDDGDLIHELTTPSGDHEKEYVVTLDREADEKCLEKLRTGVFLEDLGRKTRPCAIKKINKKDVMIVLTEGVNRQIRRMFKTCGYNVEKLVRVRIMNVKLAGLAPGEYRILQGEEIKGLYNNCGLGGM